MLYTIGLATYLTHSQTKHLTKPKPKSIRKHRKITRLPPRHEPLHTPLHPLPPQPMPNVHPQFQFHPEPYPTLQFSFCSTKIHAHIRVPQPGSWISDVEGESDEEGESVDLGGRRII